MDFSITPKQQSLVNEVRELAENEIKPYAKSHDFTLNDSFDRHLVGLLGKHNLVCPTIPVEYGGLGLDMFTTALVMEEIAAACPGLAAVVDANIHAAVPLILGGNPEQKERFLTPLAGPDAGLAAFALTEPSGGSDIESMHTLAVKSSGSYIVNGLKDYVINALDAQFLCVFTATDIQQKKPSQRCFIIPPQTPGLRIGPVCQMAVLDYARIGSITFENAPVETSQVIKEDEAYSGYLLLQQTFDIGRVLVGATAVGFARAAYELASEFASSRTQFGTAIKNHQAVSHNLVEMYRLIETARLMTWKACWLIDQLDDYTVASALAKISGSMAAQQVTSMAADILGARAFEKGSMIEELIRSAHVLSVLEGSNNIQRNTVAAFL